MAANGTSQGRMGRLRCTAGAGMFPHESGILLQGIGRCYESLIDSNLISFEGDDSSEERPAKVCVEIITEDPSKSAFLIELPRQVVSGGGRRVWVPAGEVEEG